ncbi:DUF2927 domain-containing protein [Donghicola mangrovi]|uniref:DUF2927 domain-containing protein n=1 Tax=Donghicola mangrovi TaxID=2729614 RepID=A0A850Q8R8_9RHOB|nr:DUF2927 domain-containing protein [Donghicola mangrovi]NVO23368.1 DUF2927 domain-containing protein [Donghicola mangrovi]
MTCLFRRIRFVLPTCLAGVLLAGCAPNPEIATVTVPRAAQHVSPAARALLPDPNPPYTPASYQSRSLAAYYGHMQDKLLASGKLRQDTGQGVAITADQLTKDFIDIAMKDEYMRGGSGTMHRSMDSVLRRWEKPIRVFTVFGATVPPTERERANALVASYVNRLARVTGHDIQMTTRENANYYVMFMGEDDRMPFGETLKAAIPEIDPATMNVFKHTPRNQLCVALTFREQNGSPVMGKALAMIRSEHPQILRLSCLHEEMAQALGLPNDSPTARPSIFNDDEEFALLTTHDELLLRILYDRRLKPGMTQEQALPIVRQIAGELVGR